MFDRFDPKDPEAMKRWREVFSPQAVDQMIRQAVQMCWMMLPPERRSVEEVEKEVRRLVERALRNFREDAQTFRPGT